jgi:hypothetical protein
MTARHWKVLLLTAAVMFAGFEIVAFTFRRTDVAEDRLSLIGGVMAYVFLAFAAVVVGHALLSRRRIQAERLITGYLQSHPVVLDALGRPVRAEPPTEALGAKAGQANLDVPVTGPLGAGTAHLVLARLGGAWEVLSAHLVVDGERLALSEAGEPG